MFNPLDFIDVAEFLEESKLDKKEAKNRTIIGRYYYASFLFLREILKENLKNYNSKEAKEFLYLIELSNSHKIILDFLNMLKKEDGKFRKVYNALYILRDLRNASDYELENPARAKSIKEMVDFNNDYYVELSKNKYQIIVNSKSDFENILKDISKVNKILREI